MNVLRTLRTLLGKDTLDAEMSEELRTHLEMQARENIARGMTPDEARYASRRSFGGVEQIKERARDQRRRWAGAGEFLRDLRFAVRSLRRAPTFTMVTILSLGGGLALAGTVLAVTRAYFLRELPYPQGERLYHLRYAPPGPYEPRGMNAIDWRALASVVEAPISSTGEGVYLGDGAATQALRALRVSPGFMTGLGVTPVFGRTFTEEEFAAGGPEVALLGHAVWQARFNADPGIVGRTLTLRPENETATARSVTIVGVLPPGFWFGRNSSAVVEFMLPLRFAYRPYVVRLREGVPVALAEQRMTEAARQVGSDFRPGWQGLQLDSVHARYVEELRPLVEGINAATALVVVLVCTNVAVLVLLRGLRRRRELAVRAALGAGQRHVLRLLLAEAVVLGFAALALALGLIAGGMRAAAPMIEAQLGRPPPGGVGTITVDFTVVAMVGGVGAVVVLALALSPLLATRGWRLAEALRVGGVGSTDGRAMRRLRSLLIAGEVAGAFLLLVGGGLMLRSVLNLTQTELGFDAERVARVQITLPAAYRDAPAQARFFEPLAERLAAAHPAAALGSSYPPFYESQKRNFEWEGGPAEPIMMGGLTVGAGYFYVHGIAVQQGREFSPADRFGAEPVAIVSESLARHLWPDGGALGRRLRGVEVSEPGREPGPWRTVVGVVRDVRQTYGDEDRRDVYFPFLQSPTRFGSVQLRLDRTGVVAPAQVAALVQAIDPLVRVGKLSRLADEDVQFTRARFLAWLVGGFAGFATLLALLGLYGATGYTVQQREREIAIRLSLGATPRAVLRLFLRDGGWVIGGGILVGLGASLAAGRAIESFVFGVRAFDATTLLSAGALLAGAGLLTIWGPVRRVARIEPSVALRAE